MKPPWQQQQEAMRKQQEQMRRQQEQMRRQQQMAYWQQQQKAKRQQAVPRAARVSDTFAQVEAEADKLRQDFASGRLAEPRFKEKMGELKVQDAQGTWWMAGLARGEWWRYDGSNWIRSARPSPADLTPAWSPAQYSGRYAESGAHPFRGLFVLLLGLGITFGLGLGAAAVLGTVVGAVAVWLIGLILIITITRRAWRGRR